MLIYLEDVGYFLFECG